MTPAETAWTKLLRLTATVKTGNRANMNSRHDRHLIRYAKLLGWKTLLRDIESCQFRILDYFWKRQGDTYARWDQMAQEKAIAERKALEEVERLQEEKFHGEQQWDPQTELEKLQNEYGPRSPQAVQFEQKWRHCLV